jgi:hypothetical protein
MREPQEIEFLTKFIVESDHIEGISRNPGHLQSQIIVGDISGHHGAITLLLKAARERDLLLEESMVLNTQAMIAREQPYLGEGKLPEKYIGRYRDCEVVVGGRRCVSPGLVRSGMTDWIKEVNGWQGIVQTLSPQIALGVIARFHWQYEVIHPFVDGNGRSGRALALYMMEYAGLKPFVFTAHDKHSTYYSCFNNPEPYGMVRYFRNRCEL